MNADEIKALRSKLRCTARELANAIDVEQQAVLSWELGESFPTKKHVDRLLALGAKGPSAIARTSKRKTQTPMGALGDAQTWMLLRKLIAHDELRKATLALASKYPDPLDAEE